MIQNLESDSLGVKKMLFGARARVRSNSFQELFICCQVTNQVHHIPIHRTRLSGRSPRDSAIPTADEYLRATRTAIISILKSPTASTHLFSEVRELSFRMKINEPEDWPEARAVSESPAEAFPENFGIRLKFIRHFIDETMPVDT